MQLWLSLGQEQVVFLVYPLVTQDTCPHDAKVKMAGYDGMYECTRCHKFIRTVMPKQKENWENDETAPDYLEKEWEDDDWN